MASTTRPCAIPDRSQCILCALENWFECLFEVCLQIFGISRGLEGTGRTGAMSSRMVLSAAYKPCFLPLSSVRRSTMFRLDVLTMSVRMRETMPRSVQ